MIRVAILTPSTVAGVAYEAGRVVTLDDETADREINAGRAVRVNRIGPKGGINTCSESTS